MVFLAFIPKNVNAYTLTLYYISNTDSFSEDTSLDTSYVKPIYEDNYYLEDGSVSFHNTTINESYNLLGGSYDLSYGIEQFTMSNGTNYDSSCMKFDNIQSSGGTFYQYLFCNSKSSIDHNNLTIEFLFRTNLTDFTITLREYTRRLDVAIDMDDIFTSGRDFTDLPIYFKANISTSKTFVEIRDMNDFSNPEYVYGIKTSQSATAPQLFVYDLTPQDNSYFYYYAINSNLQFSSNISVNEGNFTIFNHGFYNYSICNLSKYYQYGSDIFGINETNHYISNGAFTHYDGTSEIFYNESLTQNEFNLRFNDETLNYTSVDLLCYNLTGNSGFFNLTNDFYDYEKMGFIWKISSNFTMLGLNESFRYSGGFDWLNVQGVASLIADEYRVYNESFGSHDDYSAFKFPQITIQYELYNNSNSTPYYNLFLVELGVSYYHINTTIPSDLTFSFDDTNYDMGCYFAGMYNSTTQLNQLNCYYYRNESSISNSYTFTNTYRFFQRFLYYQANISNNLSLYTNSNFTVNFRYDFTTVENSTTSNQLTINNLTSTVNETSLYFIVNYTLTDKPVYNFTIHHTYVEQFNVSYLLVVYGYPFEPNISIIDDLISFVPFIVIFLVFPMVFKQHSKSKFIIVLGMVMSCIVLAYSGMLSIVQAIILILIILIPYVSIYTIKKKDEM